MKVLPKSVVHILNIYYRKLDEKYARKIPPFWVISNVIIIILNNNKHTIKVRTRYWTLRMIKSDWNCVHTATSNATWNLFVFVKKTDRNWFVARLQCNDCRVLCSQTVHTRSHSQRIAHFMFMLHCYRSALVCTGL